MYLFLNYYFFVPSSQACTNECCVDVCKQIIITFVQFAEWCLAYGTHGCRIPDRPYSLFEGIKYLLFSFPLH